MIADTTLAPALLQGAAFTTPSNKLKPWYETTCLDLPSRIHVHSAASPMRFLTLWTAFSAACLGWTEFVALCMTCFTGPQVATVGRCCVYQPACSWHSTIATRQPGARASHDRVACPVSARMCQMLGRWRCCPCPRTRAASASSRWTTPGHKACFREIGGARCRA